MSTCARGIGRVGPRPSPLLLLDTAPVSSTETVPRIHTRRSVGAPSRAARGPGPSPTTGDGIRNAGATGIRTNPTACRVARAATSGLRCLSVSVARPESHRPVGTPGTRAHPTSASLDAGSNRAPPGRPRGADAIASLHTSHLHSIQHGIRHSRPPSGVLVRSGNPIPSAPPFRGPDGRDLGIDASALLGLPRKSWSVVEHALGFYAAHSVTRGAFGAV